MSMKVDSNKGIHVLDVCRDDHDAMPLVDPSTKLPPCQLQELPCLSLVLLRLEFIIRLIESACTSLLLAKLDPLIFKQIGGHSSHTQPSFPSDRKLG